MTAATSDQMLAHFARTRVCPSCSKQVIFLSTAAGKSMPVDAETVAPDDQAYDRGRHRSHFATCTRPDKYRRRR